MSNPPTAPDDIVNRALDYLGIEDIAEMSEGTQAARAAIRHYGPSVRDLLRAAPWTFARKARALDLMYDAGALLTPEEAAGLAGHQVPPPWRYEYQYPQDCVRVRYLPAAVPGPPDMTPPPMTGLPYDVPVPGQRAAPFVVGNDQEITVILTDVRGAWLVYTAAIFNPQLWDALFMSALVPLLAGRLAMALVPDKKLALQLRAQASGEAAIALNNARVADGNEGMTSQDHLPDFMRIRGVGGHSVYGGLLPTGALSAWDPLSLPDGISY